VTTRLIARPVPELGESRAGYLERLAGANGFRSSAYLFRHVFKKQLPDGDYVEDAPIRALTGHGERTLERLWLTWKRPGRNKVHFQYRGVPIERNHLRGDLQFCPDCWKESAYVRADWRLAWKPLCAKHGKPHILLSSASSYAAYRGHFELCGDCIYSNLQLTAEQVSRVIDTQAWIESHLLALNEGDVFAHTAACEYVNRVVGDLNGTLRSSGRGAPWQHFRHTPSAIIRRILAQ
jgi:hypothetical protein